MVEILSLVLQHDEQAVLCAAETALEEGVPTRTRILNPPHRPIDGKPTRPATMPFAARRALLRHDPASAAVMVMLRSVRMYGMARAAGDLIEQGAPAFDTAPPILSQMLKAEVAEREVRSIACRMKAARFPACKVPAPERPCFRRSERGHGAPAAPLRVYRRRA